MSSESTIQRYKTFDPKLLGDPEAMAAAEAEGDEDGRVDRGVRYLTWGILSVCLALWAVIGFIFWVPLLLRSMIHFSLALSQSMLQGTRPVEAGRVLRETVDFYRRGFTVAIAAVFRRPSMTEKQVKTKGLTPRRWLFEITWTALFWYLALLGLGVVETSPVDAWNALVALPWGEWWQSLTDTVNGWVAGGDAPIGAGVPPAGDAAAPASAPSG
ncbi:MAG TPA: hypothetical protein VK858_10855 [Longimicrobiales bacterium]|nr:hypothetical protein [Longimicrobiales bacterium]